MDNVKLAPGLIRERGGKLLTIRLHLTGGILQAEQLSQLGKLAQLHANGFVHITSRQGVEIPGISPADLQAATAELAGAGLVPGSMGPRLRNVLACPGTVSCSHGLMNSREMGFKLNQLFNGQTYPVKIKMAISGCPNSCTTPQTNDIGLVGTAEPLLAPDLCMNCGLCADACKERAITMQDDLPLRDAAKCLSCGDCISACPAGAWTAGKSGYTVFVGGRVGRHPRIGLKLADLVTEEQAPEVVSGIVDFIIRHARKGEKLGSLLDRVGLAALKEHLNQA